MLSRRTLLAALGSGAALGGRPSFAQPGGAGAASAAGARITLLGTAGGPPPHLGRSQPANLLQVDGRAYLIDAGENVGQQLLRAGAAPSRVAACFITHLHWDHTLGLDYLMATGWMMGRVSPMPIWGPPGTSEFVRREVAAVGIGEQIFRAETPGNPPMASLYPAREADLSGQSEILVEGALRVSAAVTSHFGREQGPDSRTKAYAYRFDTPYGAVTFTGDTGPSEAVEALAQGSDVLVGEICDFDSMRRALEQAHVPAGGIDPLLRHMREQHLSPEELGKMASRARVGKLVLTHYVMGREYQPEAFVEQVRRVYAGEIVVGRDLLAVPLGAR